MNKVSVIIPTYNRAAYIRETIESVLAQTHQDFEILVIDDGSTDGTSALMADLVKLDPRIQYLPQKNGGVSSARNHGIRQAKGDWIAFLDSDDTWSPNKLELQLEVLKAFPAARMVWSDMLAFQDGGPVLYPRYLRKMYAAYKYYPSPEDIFTESKTIKGEKAYFGDLSSKMVLGNLVHTSTVLVSRQTVLDAGFFRQDFTNGGEDFEFHLRICQQAPVAFLDSVTTQYRLGLADAITHPRNRLSYALSFQQTLQATLAAKDKQIDLPADLIKRCLADSHSWVGRERLSMGQPTEARKEFMTALKMDIGQVTQLKYVAASFLPKGLRAIARKLFSQSKS